MKLKKIYGVPLSVCSGEQKIASNYAWRYRDILRRNYETAKSKSDFIEKWASDIVDEFIRVYPEVKINTDAVRLALIGGLEQYITGGGSGIFTSYEEIGRAFPLAEAVR